MVSKKRQSGDEPVVKILVVDNQNVVGEDLLASAELDWEIRTTRCDSLISAGDLLETQHFDLVVIALDPPEPEAFSLLAGLREDWFEQELPVMMVLPEECIVTRQMDTAISLGANECIFRPIDPELFAACVISLIRVRQAYRNARTQGSQTPKSSQKAELGFNVDTEIEDEDTEDADFYLPCELPVIVVLGTRNFFSKTVLLGRNRLEVLTFEDIPPETLYKVEMIDPQGETVALQVVETSRTNVETQKEGILYLGLKIVDEAAWYDEFYTRIHLAFEQGGRDGLEDALKGAQGHDTQGSETKSMPQSVLFQAAPFARRVAGGVRYRFEKQLGEGGFASVFLVRDLALKRSVAMKVLAHRYATQPGPREQFLCEAQIAAQFHHPKIVFVYEVGEFLQDEIGVHLDFPKTVLKGFPERFIYFTMQFIEGKTLGEEILSASGLSADASLSILIDVAETLHYAHGRGVVHRDVKPENIMIDNQGQVIVTDLGTATFVMDEDSSDAPDDNGGETVIPALTPSFASPEQLLGSEIDHRSDIYSLGATAYAMLTGSPPFLAHTFSDLVRLHVKQPPEPLTKRKPGIDPLVEKAVLKCLEKKPAKRFQTMEQLAGVLRKIRDHTEEVSDSSWENRFHDLLERIILADSQQEAGDVLNELIALIRLHKNSPIPNRLERIRVMIADPSVLDLLVEKNLHRQNRGLLFQLIRELESSTIAFVLLQRFQLEKEAWKKEFLAKLAVLSSRKNLLPLVQYSHEFSDSDAAAMIQASVIAESHLTEDVLMQWAGRPDRSRQMAVLDVCAKIAARSDDAREILQLLASGVGTTSQEVQDRAVKALAEVTQHRRSTSLYQDV